MHALSHKMERRQSCPVLIDKVKQVEFKAVFSFYQRLWSYDLTALYKSVYYYYHYYPVTVSLRFLTCDILVVLEVAIANYATMKFIITLYITLHYTDTPTAQTECILPPSPICSVSRKK